MTMMFLLNSLDVGGSESKVVRVSNELVKQGVDVRIVYLGGGDALINRVSKDVELLNLNYNIKSITKASYELFKYIRNNNVSTIYTVNMFPMIFVVLSKVLLRKKLKWFSLINTTYFESLKKEIQMVLYRIVLFYPSFIVFGAEEQKRVWNKRYLINDKSSEVIYNGVDNNFFSFNAVPKSSIDELYRLYNIDDFDRVYITVAQLRSEKRHIDIIEAARITKKLGYNFLFLFVGTGLSRNVDDLKKLVDEYNLSENIIFIGQVGDPRPLLSISNGFILASESETFSNAALEAMSMGLPCILSNVGGASEMVIPGYNGFLFQAKSSDSLVEQIFNHFNSDNSLLSENAKKLVEDKFSFSQMIQQYLRLYKGSF
ncbi:glycosyltransferase [Aliamphritea ceti]|uniref:glycosyltransferase n=1 Tax=Aliamphritea ceti TaxID=1524258 RepID=UPI0021C25C57|nr:glycosyltransferase [Aliamphritea ceti]